MIETTTGKVTEIDDEVLARIQRIQQNAEYLKSINFEKMTPRRQKQLLKTGRAKIGRNEFCPCGSTHLDAAGEIKRNKFKRCCWGKKATKPLDLSEVPVEAAPEPRGNIRSRFLYD